ENLAISADVRAETPHARSPRPEAAGGGFVSPALAGISPPRALDPSRGRAPADTRSGPPTGRAACPPPPARRPRCGARGPRARTYRGAAGRRGGPARSVPGPPTGGGGRVDRPRPATRGL